MAGSKGSKYFDIFLKYKIDLYSKNTNRHINDEFIKLLKEINNTGSITTAAKIMNHSYRKVWGDIQRAEDFLGFPLVKKTRGGVKGGNTVLTKDGNDLLLSMEKLHEEFDIAINKVIKRFFNKINK